MDATRSNYKPLLQIIAAQAQRTPEAIAAIHGEEVMTYRELNHRANQLAHWLRAEGVEAGVRVGLCLEHGLDLMVAVLGILKSGGICVPLEPDDPALRLAWLLSDTQPLLTVTQQALLEHLPTACESIRLDGDSALLNRQPTHEPTYPVDSRDLAFIFYTSGTTGQPKGVMHSHNELVTAYTWLEGYYEITPQDCGILRIASHLVGFRGEVLSMLVSGAKTIVADHRRRNDVEHLLDLILRHGISFIRLTPTMLKGLLDSPRIDQCRSLRHVVCSGEPLPQDLEERFLSRLPAVKLHLFYGATEAPGAMCRICQPGDRQASNRIGRPVAKSYVRLLSPDLQPVAQGAEGEICIGGAVVSQGYWNRPDLTAARFILDPLGTNPNDRLYRTGDRGRELDDGQIVYLGRSDRQANLRGLRIDLNEIEHSLRSHPHVGSAVVLVREERPGEQRLIAYLTPTSTDRPPLASTLRAFLAERLPVAMIPERFIVLSQFPMGRSGKVDYAALPAPGVEPGHPHEDTPSRHARHDDVTNDESTVELMTRLRRLGVALSVTGNRLKCQAPEGVLTETLLEGIKARKADLIDFIREHVSDDSGGDVPLVAIARTEPLPLSHAQQQLWFLARLEPGNPFYHGDLILELDGPLDRAALQVALQQLIERHEPLRTRFVQCDGHLCQRIQAAQPIECPFWMLQEQTPEHQAEAIRSRLDNLFELPFDLEQGPPLRLGLLQLDARRHLLMLILHHIAFDGWSLAILQRDLAALYRAARTGEAAHLPALPIQYADFAHWQRQWLQGDRLDRLVAYWRERLSELPDGPSLPTDRPRPPRPGYRGGRHRLYLDAALTRAIDALARTTGTTRFMLLLTAFQVWLMRYSGEADIAVATPIANRRWRALEDLIGCFVNTLILRTDLGAVECFPDALKRVRMEVLSAFEHQDLPFDVLVERLNPVRHQDRHPLTQIVFAVHNTPQPVADWGELSARPWPQAFETVRFDLEVHVWPDGEGLDCDWLYSRELWEPDSIARMAGHFQTLLAGLLAEPDRAITEIPMLSKEDDRLLWAWNQTETPYSEDRTLVDLFEQQVERTPNSVALVFDEQSLSYAELNGRANRLAHHLMTLGMRPETLVGICVERSLEMVIGLLAILKAGGAYLPLDPDDPPARLAFMLTDAGVGLLLTQTWLVERCADFKGQCLLLDAASMASAEQPTTNPGIDRPSEPLAYVIHTSGSTGQPKGVCIPHRGIVRLVRQTDYFPFSEQRVFLQLAPVAFDAATFEIWGALLNGARLVMAPPERITPAVLGELIARHGVDTLWLTSSLFNLVVDQGRLGGLRPLRYLLVGGEALSVPHVRQALQHLVDTQLINGYGPTENTTFTCCFPITALSVGERIPIGRPIANTQVYLLDARQQRVPIGVPGELYIAGAGLARGYLNRPELTAERFIHLPGRRLGLEHDDPVRLYKTGDRARWRPDGQLEFLGRLDHQVKLRGFRIELGEIEVVLQRQSGVRQVSVLLREDRPGDPRLVAYLVMESAEPIDTGTLRRALAESLPAYMLPAAFVRLDVLPLMPNGKLDRQALPAPIAPEPVSPSTVSMGIPNPLEQRLLVIWRQVLGLVETPGIHDDFFDLGGHSLLAATLVHTIETELQVRLPLAALFRFSTVARLAESLSEQVTVSREAGSAPPSAAPELSETLYRTLLSFHVGRRQARLAPDSLLMHLNPEASGVPLYFCGAFEALAAALPERPIIAMDSGVGAMAVTSANVQALADHYVRELLDQRLSGPFVLLGHSLGAWVAFEMAQRLLARGYAVPLLGLIDHPVDHPYVGRVAQFIADRGPFRKRCDTDAWRQACSQHFPAGMSLDYVPGNHVSILRQGAAAQLLAERIEARLVQTARSIRPLSEDARRPCWQAPDELGWAMDECATVTLNLTNVSMSVWGEEHDLAVGYHWYDDHQRLVEWAAGVQSLALPLSPGQTASLRYDIAAPGGPGRYRLVFDLLDRAGTWGSLSQRDSLAVAVEIQPPRVGSGDVESARRAWSAGRDLETIRACERLLASRDSAPLGVFQQLVQALQRWGCPERALEQVRRGLATYPDDVQLHRLNAELALMLDQSDQAFEAARRLLDLESGQPANWALLAQACAQKGDHPAAIEAYRRALSQRAEFEWHKALANCLEQAGQFAAAATEWRQAVTLKPGLLPLAMRLAQALRKSNQPQAALDVYRQVIDRDPEHLEGHRLAMDLLRELGRAEEALALLDAAPSGLVSSARLQGARGDGLLALGRSEAALDAFRLGTQLDPGLAANWLKTANIQIQQGQVETAAITLDEGLRHNPDDIRLLLRRGGLLMNRERQPQQALTLFERVLAQRTNHFQAHWQRAEALARLGRWAEAESAYRSANRIDPLHAQAQAGLERVRARMARLKTDVHS